MLVKGFWTSTRNIAMKDTEVIHNLWRRFNGMSYDKSIEDVPVNDLLEKATSAYQKLLDLSTSIAFQDELLIAKLECDIESFKREQMKLKKELYNLKKRIIK